MKKILALFAASAALLCAAPVLAANCSPLPYTLTNGTTADASQVMADFNDLLGCSNSSLAHNGANLDITSLGALTTPITILQGGTGNNTGNAATATKLQTGRTLAITGDLSWTSPGFDGSGNVTAAGTLANSGVGAGTYGDSGHVSQVTVDAKGRVTGAAAVAINYPSQLPAMSGSTSGALLSNNGSSAVWSQRLSAYFSSCSSSGCTLAAGNGISGVTRQALGNYLVNFSTAMPNTNYTVICTSGAYGSGTWNATCADNTLNTARGTSNVSIEIVTGGNGPIDPSGGFNILIIQN